MKTRKQEKTSVDNVEAEIKNRDEIIQKLKSEKLSLNQQLSDETYSANCLRDRLRYFERDSEEKRQELVKFSDFTFYRFLPIIAIAVMQSIHDIIWNCGTLWSVINTIFICYTLFTLYESRDLGA